MQIFCSFSVLLIEVSAGKQAQLAGAVSTQARANGQEDTPLHSDASNSSQTVGMPDYTPHRPTCCLMLLLHG
jgi:hypothetical protein